MDKMKLPERPRTLKCKNRNKCSQYNHTLVRGIGCMNTKSWNEYIAKCKQVETHNKKIMGEDVTEDGGEDPLIHQGWR